MKFLTILVILLSTTSCTVDWNGKQADKIVSLENEIAELKKEKEQDIFKRKQDCASKISYLKKEVEKNNSEFASKYSFIEVFYSPSESECYFTMWYGDIFNVTEDRLVEVDPYLWVGKTLRVYGSDISNGDSLGGCRYQTDKCSNFDKKIEELKGEK